MRIDEKSGKITIKNSVDFDRDDNQSKYNVFVIVSDFGAGKYTSYIKM